MRERELMETFFSESARDIEIWREPDGSYTVDHLPLCGVCSGRETYRSLSKAAMEARRLLSKQVNIFLIGSDV